MKSLHETFGYQSRQARQASMKAIMNTHMKLGTIVRDHMLTKIGHFNVAEILWAKIDWNLDRRDFLDSSWDVLTF